MEFDKFMGYKYRRKIKINTTKAIKKGLNCVVDSLPDSITKMNKHDLAITMVDKPDKKLSHLWDYGEEWSKYNNSLIILDEFECCHYTISIPVPEDIGKVEYYIYYNKSKNDILEGKNRKRKMVKDK